MAWEYSGDPSSSDKDLARFLVGDTDTNDQLLSDAEINYVLSQKGNAHAAAPILCTNIMAKLARKVDYAIGPEKVTASQRFEHYKDLVKELRQNWRSANAAPLWEGSDHSGLGDLFAVGMFDNGDGGGSDGLSD